MKFVLVDGENVGVKGLEKVSASVVDKVLVFSRATSVKQFCDKALYQCISEYPPGANQADFYIISYLSRVLSSLSNKMLPLVQVELVSNDANLIAAFEFQCKQIKVQYHIVRTLEQKVVTLNNRVKHNTLTSTEKLYAALRKPSSLDEALQNKLGLAKLEFSRAVTALTTSKKIVRTSANSKKWVQAS